MQCRGERRLEWRGARGRTFGVTWRPPICAISIERPRFGQTSPRIAYVGIARIVRRLFGIRRPLFIAYRCQTPGTIPDEAWRRRESFPSLSIIPRVGRKDIGMPKRNGPHVTTARKYRNLERSLWDDIMPFRVLKRVWRRFARRDSRRFGLMTQQLYRRDSKANLVERKVSRCILIHLIEAFPFLLPFFSPCVCAERLLISRAFVSTRREEADSRTQQDERNISEWAFVCGVREEWRKKRVDITSVKWSATKRGATMAG